MRAMSTFVDVLPELPTAKVGDVIFGGRGGITAPRPVDVLFCEDDDADAFLIETALAQHPRIGNVVRARNGEEAVEMALFCKPDLAVIDLFMPKVDGFALLLEMGRRVPDLPCAILTSSRSGADRHRSFFRGAKIVACKPKRLELFGATIDAILDSF